MNHSRSVVHDGYSKLMRMGRAGSTDILILGRGWESAMNEHLYIERIKPFIRAR